MLSYILLVNDDYKGGELFFEFSKEKKIIIWNKKREKGYERKRGYQPQQSKLQKKTFSIIFTKSDSFSHFPLPKL